MILIHDFVLFAFASLMLNITPGNDMIYVATRGSSQGIKAGIISALGIMGGCLFHIIAAVAGLSAIIARSAMAFELIKYAGAVYLIYLGLKSILNKKTSSFQINSEMKKLSYRNLFWQGVVTNILNPKVALFFLAFLTQFIDPAMTHPQWKILFLGTWFACSGTIVNIVVAIIFGKMGNKLARSQRFLKWQEKITGALLIGLGIKVAMTSKK